MGENVSVGRRNYDGHGAVVMGSLIKGAVTLLVLSVVALTGWVVRAESRIATIEATMPQVLERLGEIRDELRAIRERI